MADERFWAKVRRGEHCWTWTAGCNKAGYGTFRVSRSRKMILAHRHSWELANGSVPDGLCVLHSCDNPPCVNPVHLFLGTRLDNNRDKIAKGRGVNPIADAHRAKTHCCRGHEFTADNTRMLGRTRQCIQCRFVLNRSRRGKRRAA